MSTPHTAFLHEALVATGVDTTQPFTVKITGGPDGDVAGNMLKILHREYGSNARVVGLADGTAVLEDPDGVDWEELLRMFREVVPLAGFAPERLGARGVMTLADSPEGINLRNTMHNRVEADAFVPAGGRPATINDGNWQNFLLPSGAPSSPLIVEGANLFLTPGARARLGEAGVVIVKDSSANKCGVICSSFEIIASMLLDKAEFLRLKDAFVEDVLEELRDRAQKEATLMFREHKADPSVPLPQLSERISLAINRGTDALAAAVAELPPAELTAMLPMVRRALPRTLDEAAGDRLEERLPPAYVRFQLASTLASRIVYREGTAYVMAMPDDVLAAQVLRYARAEAALEELAAGQPDGFVREVLSKGGARTVIDHHIDLPTHGAV